MNNNKIKNIQQSEIKKFIDGKEVIGRRELLLLYPEKLKSTTFNYFFAVNKPRYYLMDNKYYFIKSEIEQLLKEW